jgi:hypothetical protein
VSWLPCNLLASYTGHDICIRNLKWLPTDSNATRLGFQKSVVVGVQVELPELKWEAFSRSIEGNSVVAL